MSLDRYFLFIFALLSDQLLKEEKIQLIPSSIFNLNINLEKHLW